MVKAATKPAKGKGLLEEVPGELADLHRDGGGFNVSIVLLPDIATPREAHVTVRTEKTNVLDTFTAELNPDNPGAQIMDLLHHTSTHSVKLRNHLTGREEPKKKEE